MKNFFIVFLVMTIVYNSKAKSESLISEAGLKVAWQQGRTISGKVADQSGMPLAGVNVALKNSKIGTQTDGAGNFRLSNVPSNGILVFSLIGFESRELPLTAADSYQVKLVETVRNLEEVVVIGYGTTTRADLTGSVGSVSIEDMSKAPVASFDQALAGRIAGVQVTSGDGQPGSGTNITIRGGNSITQSNSPLYVIDGFPLEDPDASAINPDDIASIEVLKDASSTAIYGARGANGVVIITTKKGQIGAPVVTYNNWIGYQAQIKEVPVLSAYEFVKYQQELAPAVANRMYLDNGRIPVESYRDSASVNWQDHLIKDAIMHNHNVSIRGGNNNTRYFLSGSYLDQDGIIINSGFNRYQARVVVDQTLSKKFKVGLNATYSKSNRLGQISSLTSDNVNSNSAGNVTSYLFFSAWGYRPVPGANRNIDDFFNDPFDSGEETGDALSSDLRINPVINTKNMHQLVGVNTLFANAYLDYDINKYLKLSIKGGMVETDFRVELFSNSKTAAGNPLTIVGGTFGVNGSIRNTLNSRLLNENILTYNRTFNRIHRVNAVAGFTMQKNTREDQGFAAGLLPNEHLGIRGLNEGIALSRRFDASYSTLASFLGRVNYNLASKYLFTATFRADGSSKFSPDNRWGYFPSGAFAWVFGKEKFMKNLSFVSSAKLRTSYGVTGNNRVTDFVYLSPLQYEIANNSGNTKSGYYFGDTYVRGTSPTAVGNYNLKWETTANLDIGLDLAFFRNKINLTTDYYYKRTTDLLLNATIPSSTGYLTGYRNMGVVSNRGFEVSLNTVNYKKKGFEWTSNFNIAFNTNRIVELNGSEPVLTTRVTTWNAQFNDALPYIAIPGESVAQFYGYVFDGVYQLDDFNEVGGTYNLKPGIPYWGSSTSSIRPGSVKYRDINGDGVVDMNDQTVIGNPIPLHSGGFTNNFKYKQFDLNVFFQWSYGNDVLNANRIIFEGQDVRVHLNMFQSYANRWSLDNQSSLIPAARGGGPNVYSSRIIEDGSFLRLKTVSIGYNLPKTALKKIKLKTVRFHASAQNLFTWTNYSGLDPEVSVRHSALTPGFDWSPYPRSKVVTAGVNVTF